MFLQNFTESLDFCIEINSENKHLLETAYEARTEKELPVLRRFFPIDKIKPNKAKYLDVILYSYE